MIQHPFTVIALLVLLIMLLNWGHTRFSHRFIFRFLPPVFWCYIIPMMLSMANILPSKNASYDWIQTWILPIALFLILTGTHLKAIAKLGRVSLILVLTGMMGTVIGMSVGFTFLHSLLPDHSAFGLGALTASWTGGSTNMLSVQQALHISDDVFTPLVITDTVLAYGWLGLLILLSEYAPQINRWLNASSEAVHEVKVSLDQLPKDQSHAHWKSILFTLGAIGAGYLCVRLGRQMPVLGSALTQTTWIVLIVTTLALLLSMTRLRSLTQGPVKSWGYFLLYLLLASIGAKADMHSLQSAPWFLLTGFICLLIHGSILLFVGKKLKAPLFLIATASQANIGGVVSAPIVAAVYEPQLASIGLMMGIVGNVLGTYIGLLSAQFFHWITLLLS